MNLTDIYNDPIIWNLRQGSSTDPFVPVIETIQVLNGTALLTEVPDRAQKVQVSGDGKQWFEVENTTLSTNTYRVDYVNGVVFFDVSNNNKSLTFAYLGKGAFYSPATRVYTKQAGNKVVETLQDVVDISDVTMQKINKTVSDLNVVFQQADTKMAQVDAKIVEASNEINTTEITRQNALTTINDINKLKNDYQTVVDETKKIYQPSVATFSAIATTYPTPQIGWTVVALDTHLEYRWDGISWINVGISDAFDGFNVILSDTQPTNTNCVWADAPVSTTGSRIKQSTTAPTNTSLLWWVID